MQPSYPKLSLAALFTLYFVWIALDRMQGSFLDNVDLPIHVRIRDPQLKPDVLTVGVLRHLDRVGFSDESFDHSFDGFFHFLTRFCSRLARSR